MAGVTTYLLILGQAGSFPVIQIKGSVDCDLGKDRTFPCLPVATLALGMVLAEQVIMSCKKV